MAALSVLFPKPLSPVSPQVSLPPLFSGICLWLSPLVVNLITLHSAVRLKHHRARAEPLLWLGFSLRLLLLIREWSA